MKTRYKKTISIKEVLRQHRALMKLLSSIPKECKKEIRPNASMGITSTKR
jgi:hypothetical protein